MTTAEAPVDESRRLTRPQEGRIVAGVCAGVARYFDIDPVILRVILAVLAIFGGAGVVIYGAGWLLIPETGAADTRLEHWIAGRHGDRRRNIIIVAIAAFVLFFVVRHNPFAYRISGAVVLVIVVMSAAALLGRWRTEHGDGWRAEHSSTLRAEHDSAPYQPDPMPAAPADTAVHRAAVPVQKRPHSWLGWLIFGAALIVAGGLSIIGLTGLAHPQPADVLAAAVAVIGIGLIVGAVRGRAWLMIPVGLLLVALLGVADALPRNLTWTAGSRTWTPTSATVSSPYVLGAGDATLDLSQVGAGQTATIVGRIGAGRLTVLVPRDSSVSVDARMSAGRISLFGHEEDGTGLDNRWTVTRARPGAGTLTLDLQGGYGDMEVRYAPA